MGQLDKSTLALPNLSQEPLFHIHSSATLLFSGDSAGTRYILPFSPTEGSTDTVINGLLSTVDEIVEPTICIPFPAVSMFCFELTKASI